MLLNVTNLWSKSCVCKSRKTFKKCSYDLLNLFIRKGTAPRVDTVFIIMLYFFETFSKNGTEVPAVDWKNYATNGFSLKSSLIFIFLLKETFDNSRDGATTTVDCSSKKNCGGCPLMAQSPYVGITTSLRWMNVSTHTHVLNSHSFLFTWAIWIETNTVIVTLTWNFLPFFFRSLLQISNSSLSLPRSSQLALYVEHLCVYVCLLRNCYYFSSQFISI